MKILDYNMKSKGACISVDEDKQVNEHIFIYSSMSNEYNNLHVYCGHQQEDCIDKRDDGKALNIEVSLVQKLLKKKINL